MFWYTVLKYKVVGTPPVTVEYHEQHGLKPDEVDSGRSDNGRLAGVVQKEILRIIKRRDSLEGTEDSIKVGARGGVETVYEDFLHFATALVEDFEQAFLRMRQDGEHGVDFGVVPIIG